MSSPIQPFKSEPTQNAMRRPYCGSLRTSNVSQPIRNGGGKRSGPPSGGGPELADVCHAGAEQSWRERKPPTDSITISADLIFGDGSTGYDNRSTLNQLCSQYGASIWPDELQSGWSSLKFGIWGDVQAVATAKKAVVDWIDAATLSNRPKRPTKFPKVLSLTAKQRKRAEKAWEKEIKKNRFRQFPPADMAFQAIGSFHWPVKQFNPHEVLGTSCEALDPIRMEFDCYIQFDNAKSVFQVCGEDLAVREALLRIRKTWFQVSARSVHPARVYLLHWRDASSIPSHVYLESLTSSFTTTTATGKHEKVITSKCPKGEGFLTDQQATDRAITMSALRIERVRITIADALRKMQFYRGRPRLRIRLGTFVVTQYVPPTDGMYELKDYENMTKATQFNARVTEEFSTAVLERKLLETLLQSDDLLSPLDVITEALSLVRPSYSAVFTFSDTHGDLRLLMSWDEAPFGQARQAQFSCPSKEWTRLSHDTGREMQIVDISLTDLHTGRAMQFDLTASETVQAGRIPPALKQFADAVRTDPKAALKGSVENSFVLYNPYFQLQSLRQSIIYQFRDISSDYTLQATHFQDRTFEAGRTKLEQPTFSVTEPRWSLMAFRAEWDTFFGENERLPIGEGVKWDQDINTWFPTEQDASPGTNGFQQIVEKLIRVEKLTMERIGESDGKKGVSSGTIAGRGTV